MEHRQLAAALTCHLALSVGHQAWLLRPVLLVPSQGLQAATQGHQAAVDGHALPALKVTHSALRVDHSLGMHYEPRRWVLADSSLLLAVRGIIG